MVNGAENQELSESERKRGEARLRKKAKDIKEGEEQFD